MPTRAEQVFEQIAVRFLAKRSVSEGTGFGTNPGLRVGTKIFAMLRDGELVVKLPKDHVDRLIAEGKAARFDAGKGRPMKEWAQVPAKRAREWEAIVDEAFRFVSASAKTKRAT